MIILPNMGLAKWDNISDNFSHEQLAANWQAVDDHDHSAGKGKSIPYGGLAEQSVGSENLREGVFNANSLGAESIETSKIKSAAITDAKLASPNNSVYRILLTAQQNIVTDYGAGTYVMGSSAAGANPINGTGTGEAAGTAPPILYFAKADYEVPNKTQKLRLRAQISANATKPALKFTFALYPYTVAGAADGIKLTFGTFVEGSKVEINEPAASAVTSGVTSDFTIPADGAYLLGITTNATLTNNALVLLSAQLQTHWV